MILPDPKHVQVFGWGASRLLRTLYRERCSVSEIAAYLGWPPTQVRHALRWKGHWRIGDLSTASSVANPQMKGALCRTETRVTP